MCPRRGIRRCRRAPFSIAFEEATGAADYIEPAVSQTVPLPAGSGTVSVTMKGADFTAIGNLMLQLTPVIASPFFGRVLCDVESSKIELTCIPASGTTCA